MDVFMASLRSACSLRRGHFVNNLKPDDFIRFFHFWH
ncbi:gluconate 5-dehydrogenase [Yersinia wautersii]|nr:gluconate 5-dehydrogenase [Yersinia wautersii]